MPDNRKLKDKVVLVTGASRGIGRAIADQLADHGATLILSGKDSDRLNQTADEIRSKGVEAVAIPCDLSQPEQVKTLARHACDQFNRLDILINNAGMGEIKPFEESTDETWKTLMAVNAHAPFILCRDCLPALKKSSYATIVNIGSVMGIKGYEDQAVYAASKHALMGFTKVMAQELQAYNIRVHAVNPGGVYTDLAKTMRPDLDPDILIAPEEIADIVTFLLLHRGNAMIDDIHIRRAIGSPWY